MPCFVDFPSLPIWHYWHYSWTFVCCNSLTGCYTRDPPLAAKRPLSAIWAYCLRSGLPPEAPGTPQDPSQGTPRTRLEIACFLDVISATKMSKMASIWHPKLSKIPSSTEEAEKRICAYPPTQNQLFQGHRTPKSHKKNIPKMQ